MRKSGFRLSLQVACTVCIAECLFGCGGHRSNRPAIQPAVATMMPTHAAPPAQQVRFGPERFRVGDRWATNVLVRRAWAEDERHRSMVGVIEYTSTFIEEVLELHDGLPARARIELVSDANFDGAKGAETTLSGKAFIVDRADPQIVDAVTHAPLSTGERQGVLDLLPDFGKPTTFGSALAQRAFQIGDHCDELVGAFYAIFIGGPSGFESGTAVLERVEGDIAVFRLAMTFTNTYDQMRAVVIGSARIGVLTSRLKKLKLKGPFRHPNGMRGELEYSRVEPEPLAP